MAGYASIILEHSPLKPDQLPPEALEALEDEFDKVYTRATQRQLSVLVTEGSPEFADLRTQLDGVLARTPIGAFEAGRVIGSPKQPVRHEDWAWSRTDHRARRMLLLDDQPFVIRVEGTNWTASVTADYQWQAGERLP